MGFQFLMRGYLFTHTWYLLHFFFCKYNSLFVTLSVVKLLFLNHCPSVQRTKVVSVTNMCYVVSYEEMYQKHSVLKPTNFGIRFIPSSLISQGWWSCMNADLPHLVRVIISLVSASPYRHWNGSTTLESSTCLPTRIWERTQRRL